MKRFLFLLSLSVSGCALASSVFADERGQSLNPVKPVALPPSVEVWFSEDGSIEDKLVDAIDSAETEILCSQYLITSPRIVRALLDAFRIRGVFVVVSLEGRPNLRTYQTPAYLVSKGIAVLQVRKNRGLNNNKYWVIDRSRVITGSYDCTNIAAASNDENLLSITDPGVAIAYYNSWLKQAKKAMPLESKK